MPYLGGRQLSDIYFLDSLTGWATTPYVNVNDTAYVVKTTNGGDNWIIINIRICQFAGNSKILFLNANTGFTCGPYSLPFTSILKTTNSGLNWFNINTPSVSAQDMSILNEDTIWFVNYDGLAGGVFRTTDGGNNWTRQINLGPGNPDKIYMFNSRIGFIARWQTNSSLYKTTNSGVNWTLISYNESFNDMYFIDSLTGWRTVPMKKTTNGGLNWIEQTLPGGGNIVPNMRSFSNVNRDTIWGEGGYIFYPGGGWGIIDVTTNGGNNWYYQLPDTSYRIPGFPFVTFTNKYNGWAYSINRGIHTVTGGDTVFYTGIQKLNNTIYQRNLY